MAVPMNVAVRPMRVGSRALLRPTPSMCALVRTVPTACLVDAAAAAAAAAA
eukprot:CAMPEP_0205928244 /NCGR_PEP_ID=MMETSP1325-20131115/24351_1 /ASSEMBLY_ACC=CAM_ASM_000708 /TAXON_ID=236786 /ORGANISM="Florenciella sp., Strain RCC1007" /LENGTH=50 /DNA_ID=CAMNT_0053297247 /DNA_START=130 /DNA_END=279 /DNA_ORIENTATION=+